jgi:ribonuclease R
MGADTGLVIAIGDKVEVRLAEAVPVTGGLTLELIGFEGKEMPKRAGRGRCRGRATAQGGQIREETREAAKKTARRRLTAKPRRSGNPPHSHTRM